MKNRVVPMIQPHILSRGDAKMEKEGPKFSQETIDFTHAILVAIYKRALASGTFKPVQKASGE